MSRKQWIDFTAVREALDFASVLSHYDIDAPPGQNQFKVHCPFHEDSTPSCSINSGKGIFKCFGCHTQGNVLEFVIYMEDGDPESKEDMYSGAQMAISIMGKSPDDFTRPNSGKSAKTASRTSKKKTAAPPSSVTRKTAQKPKPDASEDTETEPRQNKPFGRELELEHEHPFLIERGIEPELAEKYGIGFCNAGIMKGRIAIPIHNLQGEVMAYAGRYASEDIAEGTDRYRFPKRFLKSLELYNLHRAVELRKRYLVIVEGYWSAIRFNEAGIPAAALMGTSLSPAQAELVRKAGFRHAILLLDGDEAGRKAAPEAAFVLSQHVYVRTMELPDGVKPDTVSEDFLNQFR